MSHLVWSRQKSCRKSIDLAAEKYFSIIDPGLVTEVFLLGIDAPTPGDKTSFFWESAEGRPDAPDFKQINDLAARLTSASPARRVKKTNKQEERAAFRAHLHGYTLAIQETLMGASTFEPKAVYVSAAYETDSLFVFIVLTLPKEVVARSFTLESLETDGDKRSASSFIASAIEVFFSDCTGELLDSQYKKRFADRSPEELLKSAGRHFMTMIEKSIGLKSNGNSLFDAFDNVSLLRYEGGDANGKILLAEEGHTNIVLKLRLSRPIPLNDSRKVRKFLELSDQQSCVVSDGEHILGLGMVRGEFNANQKSLYCIDFKGHYKWELLHNGNPLLSVCRGLPKIWVEGIDRNYFTSVVNRVFTGLNASRTDQLWDITVSATQQKSGTMLVISDHAKSEAARLAGQSFKVAPLVLTEELVNRITSIDGAVLLDKDCVCYAIGVILDGIVSDKQGDASRGARYNSAIRYFGTNHPKHSLLIIIISEDGMVDLIPSS